MSQQERLYQYFLVIRFVISIIVSAWPWRLFLINDVQFKDHIYTQVSKTNKMLGFIRRT